MNIVFLLIPLGLVLMVGAVAALFWAVNSGQYDDIEDASHTLFEPDASRSAESNGLQPPGDPSDDST